MKLTIDAPKVNDYEDAANELERIAKLIREYCSSGETQGSGWWDLSWPEDDNPDYDDNGNLRAGVDH